MGVLVTPGEPAVGPPGHEPTASAAAWTEAYPMFGKAMDTDDWFEYVLQRLTLMLVILRVKAEEVRKCESNLSALWKMVLEHDKRDTLLNDGKKWNHQVGAEYFCNSSPVKCMGGR